MSNQTEEKRVSEWGPWDEVEGAIMEIEWFVSRKKDLASATDTGEVWADVLARDIADLRKAIREAREG